MGPEKLFLPPQWFLESIQPSIDKQGLWPGRMGKTHCCVFFKNVLLPHVDNKGDTYGPRALTSALLKNM